MERAILHSNTDVVRWSTSFPSTKIRQPKKVVRFTTNHNAVIRYDVDMYALSKRAYVALFWYTAQDYAKFRSESNDMATYAAGDLDYQQFFMNTLYPYCCRMATTISSANQSMKSTTGNTVDTSMSPTDSDSDSSLSTNSCSSIGSTAPTDDDSCNSSISNCNSSASPSFLETKYTDAVEIAELEMMIKYRGLERIIFRHILQELKVDFIKRRVKEEADNCYFDDDNSDMILDDCTSCSIESTNSTTTGISPGYFRQYLFTSQVMAQFVGQIDRIAVVQENHEYILEQHKLHLERLKLARDQKKKRSNKATGKWKRGEIDDYYMYENFHQQTIEI